MTPVETSPNGTLTAIGSVHSYRSEERSMVLVAGIGRDGRDRLLEPAEARKAAAVLTAYAEKAEADGSEPSPAEVWELTQILRGIAPGMAPPGAGDYKTAVVRPFAEAALRWMKQRGEGS